MIKPGEFSAEFWERIREQVENIPTGGVLMISVERLESENTPRVRWGVFDASQRKRLRAALKREERKLKEG